MGETILTAGIDVGASAVKVAIVAGPARTGRSRAGTRLLGGIVERIRRRDPRAVIRAAWSDALAQAQVAPGDIAYTATTGEGELVENRTGHFYGMTAHARGALFLDPEARGALDVGALHARAVRIDERARVLDYRMTSQCASGSGQFLENIARYLGVTLDEVGPLSLTGETPEKVSCICAVLAETDVINMVSRGITVQNILRGIHESMAGRFAKLLLSIRVGGPVLVTGGLSADTGLLECLRRGLERQATAEVRTHPQAVLAGALGAALWGAYRHELLDARAAA
ncbi:MAG: benzoyl-CoA reductase subunit D [Candidatus Wallbacteria bacterium]|nr:benzoyl-CoA reductase subunit D [Candidatus Wallbacteria bacterium]